MPKTRKVVQPKYVEKFQCIGPACEDSCCIGWRVDIDKNTYQTYRNCSDKQLRPQMNEKVTRNRSDAKIKNYAKINLNEDGSCPFIDVDKLCAIQRKLGEGMLSVTCTTYPRTTNLVGGVLEKSLTVSCPEAARVALLNVDAMHFDLIEEDVSVRNSTHLTLDSDDIKLAHRPQRYVKELRIFAISLLQDRSYLVWQRMIILGMFCNNINEHVTACKVSDIPVLIGTYQNRLDNDIFRGVFDSIPPQITVQMELMKELTDERIFGGIRSKRFIECYSEFLQGIDYTAQTPKEDIGVRYLEAYDKYYKPFMDGNEHIMENYLVNYVFMKLFPIHAEKHVFDNYVMLVVHYAMIKMLLIGMAGYHKEKFGTEHVIKLIQSFSKVIEHANIYVKEAFKLLKEGNMNTLAYMTILIKN